MWLPSGTPLASIGLAFSEVPRHHFLQEASSQILLRTMSEELGYDNE